MTVSSFWTHQVRKHPYDGVVYPTLLSKVGYHSIGKYHKQFSHMKTARPGLPRFQGPFKAFSVSLSTNREKGTDDRLLVYSQGSRAKVHEYLWLKHLWDELTKEEMKLFLTMPETLKSEMKFGALRALLLLPKKKVRQKLVDSPLIPESERPTRLRYLGFKRLDVEILRITRSLRKVPKFSGWIRSSSAVGSKRRPGGPSYLEPLAIIENDYIDNVFDWFTYLLSEVS